MTIVRSFFPTRRAALTAALAVATLFGGRFATLRAQEPAPAQQPADAAATQQPAATPAPGQAAPDKAIDPLHLDATLSATPGQKKAKQKVAKEEKVQQSKDTKAELRKEKKLNPLVGKDANLPDKALYDKALMEANKGHYDVARLDLQALLGTYPDSQYMMRAKLAIADAWFKEGGSAAMAQAEQEYGDFITFFPNAPEAAEAQMRMGDIYFKQLDSPDRDYSKIVKAEDQYRTMLRTYPDAPKVLLTEANQRLREVQELLAEREFELGQFYASHENWAASIARYQTVADTYPQFSHMDDTLIGIGDAYATESRVIRGQNLPEAAKAQLLQEYDKKAADYYRKVVLEHAAAPHVEDAKERLDAMGLPIPTPTPEQVAKSEELEGSRAQYSLRKRLELLVVRKPDTVQAAQSGAPTLDDPAATTAPMVVGDMRNSFVAALTPAAKPGAAAAGAAAPAAEAAAPAGTGPATPAPILKAPLAFGDVPAAGSDSSAASGSVISVPASAPASVPASGTGVGVEILTPGVNGSTSVNAGHEGVGGSGVGNRASDLSTANGAADAKFGLERLGPAKPAGELPAADKAEEMPDQVNEVAGKKQQAPAAETTSTKKNAKPTFDKNDESSSKKKPKKGLNKVNPF